MSVPILEVKESIGKETIQSPISPEGLIVARNELSAPNADGDRFRLAKMPAGKILTSPLYIPDPLVSSDVVDQLATGIEPRYTEVADAMLEGEQGDIVYQIAEGLENDENYMVNMNHASLFRSGVGHRGLCRALEKLGVKFDKALFAGIMLAYLEVRLGEDVPGREDPPSDEEYMQALAATGFLGHTIVTVPNSEKVKKSGLMEFEDEVTLHRKMGKQVLSCMADHENGMIALIIGSGTHDILTMPEDGAERPKLTIKRVPEGSARLAIENKLKVIQMSITDVPGYPFDATLVRPPTEITHPDQMHGLMLDTTYDLRAKMPGITVEYEGAPNA